MRLYHFTKAEFALQDIQHRRLKIAEIQDLNDPFDLRAPQLKTSDERRRWEDWRKDMNAKFGMICFSSDWTKAVMWSHYADRHRGLCLGFDIADETVGRVQYSDERPEVDLSREPQESDIGSLLFVKGPDWRYEDEYWVWVRLEERDPQHGVFFAQFSEQMVLREVIVGPASDISRDQIAPLLVGFQPPPEMIKARLAFQSFNVVKQQLGLK